MIQTISVARGFTRAGQGNPDESRAARHILKDYVNARVLYCHPPPGTDGRQFNERTMEIQLRRAAGKKRAPLTRVPKKADTAPNILHAPDTGTPSTPLSPGAGASFKSQRLDRDFFDSQAMSSRPLIKGKGAGQAFNGRVKLYPHQNSVTDDGSDISVKKAHIVAVPEVAGGNVPGDGKKHFKGKRAKARSGKGYD
jgi:large subunit GTPase 1